MLNRLAQSIIIFVIFNGILYAEEPLYKIIPITEPVATQINSNIVNRVNDNLYDIYNKKQNKVWQLFKEIPELQNLTERNPVLYNSSSITRMYVRINDVIYGMTVSTDPASGYGDMLKSIEGISIAYSTTSLRNDFSNVIISTGYLQNQIDDIYPGTHTWTGSNSYTNSIYTSSGIVCTGTETQFYNTALNLYNGTFHISPYYNFSLGVGYKFWFAGNDINVRLGADDEGVTTRWRSETGIKELQFINERTDDIWLAINGANGSNPEGSDRSYLAIASTPIFVWGDKGNYGINIYGKVNISSRTTTGDLKANYGVLTSTLQVTNNASNGSILRSDANGNLTHVSSNTFLYGLATYNDLQSTYTYLNNELSNIYIGTHTWTGKNKFNQIDMNNTSLYNSSGVAINSAIANGYLQISDSYIIVKGTTDVEINSAISALGADGGTVELLNQTYEIGGYISLKNNLTLKGSGWGTLLKPKAWAGWASSSHTISGINVSNVAIKDLKIDGTNESGVTANLINLYKCNYVQISNCFITDADYTGIYVQECNDIDIINNTTADSDNFDIYLAGFSGSSNNERIKVQGNTINNPTNRGMAITGTKLCLITGNNFYACYMAMEISVNNVGLEINGNTFRSGVTHISAYNANLNVTNNYFYGATTVGLKVYGNGGVTAATIGFNVFDSITKNAVEIGDYPTYWANGVDLTGNSFTNGANGYDDLVVEYANAIKINNNNFTSSSGKSERAIYLMKGSTASISGNQSIGHDTCAIQIDNEFSNTTLEMNKIYDSVRILDNGVNTCIFTSRGRQFGINTSTPAVTLDVLGTVSATTYISAGINYTTYVGTSGVKIDQFSTFVSTAGVRFVTIANSTGTLESRSNIFNTQISTMGTRINANTTFVSTAGVKIDQFAVFVSTAGKKIDDVCISTGLLRIEINNMKVSPSTGVLSGVLPATVITSSVSINSAVQRLTNGTNTTVSNNGNGTWQVNASGGSGDMVLATQQTGVGKNFTTISTMTALSINNDKNKVITSSTAFGIEVSTHLSVNGSITTKLPRTSGYLSATWTIGSTAFKKVPFNTIDYDTCSGFNTTTSSYTCTEARYYYIAFYKNMNVQATPQTQDFRICVNNVQKQVATSHFPDTTTGNTGRKTGPFLSKTIWLNVGDIVRFDARCQTDTQLYGGTTDETHFEIIGLP